MVQGEGSCCSTAPWFTVDLVNSTSNDIEVRINFVLTLMMLKIPPYTCLSYTSNDFF